MAIEVQLLSLRNQVLVFKAVPQRHCQVLPMRSSHIAKPDSLLIV